MGGIVLNRRFLLLLLLVLALSSAVSARADNISEYIRLHVVAEDDTDAAQTLKLQIRDACLDQARALLNRCYNAETAWITINAHRAELAQAAVDCARAHGYMGTLRCETGIFPFPERQYGDRFVPAGDYRALRVVIGAGEGRNWWCVLFPSLCYPDAMPEDGPVYYSSVWRWLTGIWGGEAA